MKRFINRESIMLIVMSIVVIAVIGTATVAWFMGASPVSVKNMELNMDDKGDLYVWVKVEEEVAEEDVIPVFAKLHSSGNLAETVHSTGELTLDNSIHSAGGLTRGNGVFSLPTDEELRVQHFAALSKVGTGNNVKYTIDFNPVAQDNIEENTFAPGAYGKVEFKILSLTSLTNGYTIKITPSIKISDKYDENTAHLTSSELRELVASHIKFYAVNHAGSYSEVIPYYDENTRNSYLTGDLEEGFLKDVVLYWYWPYEYVDIPDKDNPDSPVYEDYEKYRSLGSLEEQIEAYDWDDTYIGNYVEELTFHFDVDGNR